MAERSRQTRSTEPSASPRRILVIANETVAGHVLHDTVLARAGEAQAAEALVICPALNSRLRHFLSDSDGARLAAQARLKICLEKLSGGGVEAEGWVGDADPLQAIVDGLHVFPADEIVIATHPRGRSNWLERNLIERARERFGLPILHVVVEDATNTAAAAVA
jgi:hypothetical protein